uniref:Uncharacterized protein n=1 Tax=Siphoviridae sp. ctrWS2 TaxID=2823602 RepID=A0A8S5LEB5_9CAUD|nr:MAG TPA: hypothetical protein [Siphoviridae sp. ctrWS2]
MHRAEYSFGGGTHVLPPLFFHPFPLPPLSLGTNILDNCAEEQRKRKEGHSIYSFYSFFFLQKYPIKK